MSDEAIITQGKRQKIQHREGPSHHFTLPVSLWWYHHTSTMLSSVFRRIPAMRQTFVLSRLNFPAAFSTMPEPEGPRVVAPEDRPFLHHGQRPRFRGYKKFKSPQKRASKLLFELEKEAVSQAMESKPEVWKTDFRVGDAVEVDLLPRGGANSTNTQKARGVILGVFRKRMDYSILIRDVLEGAPVERRIPLHSPLVKAVRVLYRNYIYKGSKKVRRSKLYYLRDLPLGICQVTGKVTEKKGLKSFEEQKKTAKKKKTEKLKKKKKNKKA